MQPSFQPRFQHEHCFLRLVRRDHVPRVKKLYEAETVRLLEDSDFLAVQLVRLVLASLEGRLVAPADVVDEILFAGRVAEPVFVAGVNENFVPLIGVRLDLDDTNLLASPHFHLLGRAVLQPKRPNRATRLHWLRKLPPAACR